MSISLDGFRTVAEDGTVVTGDMVKEWDAAYDDGHLPDGYAMTEYHQGRPRIYNERMDTLTIRIPHSQKALLAQRAKAAGMSTSAYARQVIALSFIG